MPTLPLPIGGASSTGGELPVVDESYVLAVLPAFLRPDDPQPVRDAIVAAITAILLRYQDRAAFAADQSDILHAVGAALAEACAEIGVYKTEGESDDTLRARALTSPSLVTPEAILAAVNAILAPVTSILSQLSEAFQDRWYVGSDAARTWSSHIYKADSIPVSPYYLERLYPGDAAENGGYVRPQSAPGAARIYSDTIGRYFLLRVPDLSLLDSAGSFVFADPSTEGWFVGTGAFLPRAAFLRRLGATSAAIYTAIVNAVDRIKGSSIRWQLLVDPQLQ